MFASFTSTSDIGIDLGTDSVLVYIRGTGIVLHEPAVVAYDLDTNEIKSIGEEAGEMIGRTPGNITAVHPLRHGVVSDYTITEMMLRYFIHKAVGRKTFVRPKITVCVPSSVTEVEKRAVVDATMGAGARDVVLIDEAVAAALGAGVDISKPFGNLVVDIGAGTTDIAVISYGDIVVSESVKVASNDFDDAIIKYLRNQHEVLVGQRSAEEIKKTIGCAFPREFTETMEVTGRNVMTGLPKTVTINSNEIQTALEEPLTRIVEGLHRVLEGTPPELAADVGARGILLTGGGSLLYGMDKLIEEITHIRTTVADDPISVVAIGTGRYTDFLTAIKKEK